MTTIYRTITTDTPGVDIGVTDGRTLCGIVVPYGLSTAIPAEGITETFEHGVFRQQVKAPNRVMLTHLHSTKPGSTPLGHGKILREEREGLYGEFRITESAIGDHFLSLVRDGSLAEWSIGARIERMRGDTHRIYTKASLMEVSLVSEGAYGEKAMVAAVREAQPAATPRLDAWLARIGADATVNK